MDESRKVRYREKLVRLKEYHDLLNKWLHEDDIETLTLEENYRNLFRLLNAFDEFHDVVEQWLTEQ